MANVSIIGSGTWGMALSLLLYIKRTHGKGMVRDPG